MDYRKLAEDFFYENYKLKKNHHQQMIDESLQGEIFTLLYVRNRKGSVLPSEISEEMSVSTARVASILNNLENKGLINRQIDKEDRRRILVTLTDEGRGQADYHYEKVISLTARVLELIGEEDAKDFVRITSKIVGLTYQVIEKEDLI
ncbi:MAG: MarR family transcriptional regulator [Tissierellia bacterium]|nr:MarR family transcriptional regulator [Tissierellia bacterium]